MTRAQTAEVGTSTERGTVRRTGPPAGRGTAARATAARRTGRFRAGLTAGLTVLAAVGVLTAQQWATPARAVVATVPPFVQELPGPPAAYPGGSSTCAAPDPTGSTGCITESTAWLLTELESAFGAQRVSCWSEHAWNPTSDHPAGRACDVFPGRGGTVPSTGAAARGWHVAQWARVHAEALGVDYVIWWGRIWTRDHPTRGWARYDGGGVYDTTDPVGGHYDHVHISVRED